MLLRSTAHKVVAASLCCSSSKRCRSYYGILEKREVHLANIPNPRKFSLYSSKLKLVLNQARFGFLTCYLNILRWYKILRIYEKREAGAGSNYIDPNKGKAYAANQKTRYCKQLQHINNVFDDWISCLHSAGEISSFNLFVI